VAQPMMVSIAGAELRRGCSTKPTVCTMPTSLLYGRPRARSASPGPRASVTRDATGCSAAPWTSPPPRPPGLDMCVSHTYHLGMTTHLETKFEIKSWDEKPYRELPDGRKFTEARVALAA